MPTLAVPSDSGASSLAAGARAVPALRLVAVSLVRERSGAPAAALALEPPPRSGRLPTPTAPWPVPWLAPAIALHAAVILLLAAGTVVPPGVGAPGPITVTLVTAPPVPPQLVRPIDEAAPRLAAPIEEYEPGSAEPVAPAAIAEPEAESPVPAEPMREAVPIEQPASDEAAAIKPLPPQPADLFLEVEAAPADAAPEEIVVARSPPPLPIEKPERARADTEAERVPQARTSDETLPTKATSDAAPTRAKESAKPSPQQAARAVPAPVITDPRYRAPPSPPVYPRRAIAQNQQGTVIIRALVGPDGVSRRVEVHRGSGFPLLDRAAREAVEGWSFEAARIGGRAVAAWVEVAVNFRFN